MKHCPMCHSEVPVEGGEAAKTCPSCGADLSLWQHMNAPELANCPMCQKLIQLEGGQMPRTCPSCGADLTRWMQKREKASGLEVPETAPQATKESNLGIGILGALIGAALGAGLMYAFYEWAGFRFPVLGVGIGILTGFGAKLLYKGTGKTLGMIAGGVAMLAVVGTLYLMYGTFPLINIISVVVSVSFAFRIASR
jgi:predicted RNA-binding Zn-ribbon protein involved in translation (DUF1610 family)